MWNDSVSRVETRGVVSGHSRANIVEKLAEQSSSLDCSFNGTTNAGPLLCTIQTEAREEDKMV